MAALSDYLENALINHVLRNTALASPATVYLALYKDDPTDADSGTEVSGGSYARQSITFSAPSGGKTSNSTDIIFPIATGDWGTITHFGIHDDLTAGNLLLHGEFTFAKTILAGDQYIIRSGDLDIEFD